MKYEDVKVVHVNSYLVDVDNINISTSLLLFLAHEEKKFREF